MTIKPDTIKILFGGLEEDDTGAIILRGVIAPECLRFLRVDEYQREIQPLATRAKIMEGLEAGERLPDITLAMRGNKVTSREDNYYLNDHVFIVDGLQRQSTALHFMEKHNGTKPAKIGAMIYFNTTVEWERRKFQILNANRLNMSPNVLLRNMRADSPVVLALYGLTMNDKSFLLYDRVCWQQKMLRNDLITANMFTRVAGTLHSHKLAGNDSRMLERIRKMDASIQEIGIGILRENMKTFFNLIDECWGVRTVAIRDTAVQMKGGFLVVLARLFSDHHDFWSDDQEKRLFIHAPMKRKIAQFPLQDPEIRRLTTAGSTAGSILYTLLRDHIDSSKRFKHLRPRRPVIALDMEDDTSEENVTVEVA